MNNFFDLGYHELENEMEKGILKQLLSLLNFEAMLAKKKIKSDVVGKKELDILIKTILLPFDEGNPALAL